MKRDNFVFGLVLGLLMPFIAYILAVNLDELFRTWGKEIFPYVMAAAINLIALRLFYKHGFPKVGMGILFSTFISAILLFTFTEASIFPIN